MPTWIVPSDAHSPGDSGHTADHNHIADDLTLANAAVPVISGGLTGATAATRYAGATASGAPVAGTFAVGDLVIDQRGALWICTAAGTPGTWVQAGSEQFGNFTVDGTMFTQTIAVFAGNLGFQNAAFGITLKEGANARQGTLTLNGTTAVVVSNTNVTANSRIFLTIQLGSGTIGSPYVSARTAGTSFSVKSTAAGDTSTCAYLITEPS